MSVSVSMPQLGESVIEGTVTRWLKREGEHVEADEPLLEVSTDKVDTEIPSPVSGTLRGITVAEDETVAVGAELAVIDEDGAAGGAGDAQGGASQDGRVQTAQPADGQGAPAQGGSDDRRADQAEGTQPVPAAAVADGSRGYDTGGHQAPAQPQQPAYQQPGYQQPYQQPAAYQQPPAQPGPGTYQQPGQPAAYQQPPAQQPAYQQQPPLPESAPYQESGFQQAGFQQPAQGAPAGQPGPGPQDTQQGGPQGSRPGEDQAGGADLEGPANGTQSPYVTPLVRKLAAEHGVDLSAVTGTGVGGRIRKQDVLDAAQAARAAVPAAASAPTAAAAPGGLPASAPPASAPAAAAQPAAPAWQAGTGTAAPVQAASFVPGAPAEPAVQQSAGRQPIVPSRLRGTTERMSRARQVIAQRMVESLQTSAQLTTVVEVDVTAIARLRDRAKAAFQAREGVKLSFLPFFALAVVEALKVHPKLNAVIDAATGQVTYHDAEHLGIAVDTDRGLMVPVIRNAGDLNIGGLARKIADLAERTRAGQVSPDDLSGGTFTLTNTGSRGALFDTPIINQPQVGILGTGTVVKRAVVVEDPTLGEVITVRSMVYLALTYDHRLVDGADAVRFLVTMRSRLEEGAYETELGL
jgi:pyruvate dehydrogenase E2 component (dihydrolipoamide acetyltransferase)